jgi:hypothetical protein
MELNTFLYYYLLIKHYINHLVIYFTDCEIYTFFRPFVITYPYHVYACEILLNLRGIYLVYTETSKFNITIWDERYGIVALFISYVTQHTFRWIYLFQPMEYLWWVHTTLQNKYASWSINSYTQIGNLIL